MNGSIRRYGLGRGVVAAALLCAGLAACTRDRVVLAPGDRAPLFTVRDLEGNTLALADLRGKVVVLRFWADWCKACRTEMPLVEQKYREFKDRGLAVLALNVKQSPEVAARFARKLGITYPVGLDRDGSTARAYGVLGLPTTFVIDREGRILETIIGDMNLKSLSGLIDPLFADEGVAANGEAP